MKISVYIAVSLDGFIAREDGELDWLMDKDYVEEGQDYGFAEFFGQVSCLVMGRSTFEKVVSFLEWPYGDKRVVVMSRSLTALPDNMPSSVELFSGSPQALTEKLKLEGEANLYIDGGKLIQSFLQLGLIDVMTLTHIPVSIGRGIPLFGPVQDDIRFEHVRTESFATGLVQSEYLVKS